MMTAIRRRESCSARSLEPKIGARLSQTKAPRFPNMSKYVLPPARTDASQVSYG